MKQERRLLLALLAACLILFSLEIGNHDFWDPDEPRYAGVSRNILEAGDWLRLTDNGAPYTQKPPLYFWLVAATARLAGGLNETSARIPSAAAALLCAVVAYRLGSRLFGPRVGWLGAMTMATTQRFFLEARWVHLDTLLTLFVLLAMESAWAALQGEKRGWLRLYLWIALGCLVKGPLALAFPAVGILVYLATTGELSKLTGSGWAWGVPLSLLPVAGWLLVSARLAGIDPVAVIGTQVLQRFQEGVHHPRPFYYYFYSLPLEFLPWTLFLPSVVRFTLPAPDRRDRRELLFLYGWLVGGLALLSLIAEKRPSYLLPLFPALAMLVAVFFDFYLTRFDASSIRRWVEIPTGLAAAGCLLGTLVLAHLGRHEPGLRERIVPIGLFLFVGCSGAFWTQLRGRRVAALLALLATFFVGYLAVVFAVFPWFDRYKSARPFCQRIISRIGDSRLGIYGDYLPAFAYYAHRNLEILRGVEAMSDLLERPPGGYCIVPKEKLAALRAQFAVQVLEEASVGHRSFVLLGRMPPPLSQLPSQRDDAPR